MNTHTGDEQTGGRTHMYLNGKRVREAARLRTMTREQVQEKSGIDARDIVYYWDNDATTPSQAHVDALAKALGVKTDTLLWSGQPKNVTLRPDKFMTLEPDGIDWNGGKARKMFTTDFTRHKPVKEKPKEQ